MKPESEHALWTNEHTEADNIRPIAPAPNAPLTD